MQNASLGKVVVFLVPEVPFPPHSGGKIEIFFKLKELKAAGAMVFLVGAYSHEADYQGFLKTKNSLCEDSFFYKRKKDPMLVFHPVIPYSVLSCSPTKESVKGLKSFLDRVPSDVDLLVADHLNSFSVFMVVRQFLRYRTEVYRMHNIETAFLKSQFAYLPFLSPKKWVTLWDFWKMRVFEKKCLREFRNIAVISKSEISFAQKYCSSGNVFWIPPFFDFKKSPEIDLNRDEEAIFRELKDRFKGKCIFFFASNFSSGFNVAATNWFLKEIWPIIIKRNPNAFLVFGGLKADSYFSTNLEQKFLVVANFPSVKPYAKIASVFLVITFEKAGVKLKTMEALNFRKPIVSTPAGVKGTGLEKFIPNTLDALKFAEFCGNAIEKPEEYRHGFLEFARNFNPAVSAQNLLRKAV